MMHHIDQVRRIDGLCYAEMREKLIHEAKVKAVQMFCRHERQKREFMEQSNERIECLDCGKVWYD